MRFYKAISYKFKKIADGLTVVTKHTSFNLLITPPEVGTVYKMTFDYLYGNNPDRSEIYFTGTYHYDDSTKEYALKDIAYTGINCDQKFVKGTRNGLEPVKFHFAGFNLAGNKEIHKEYIKQWYKAPNVSSWQLNSEYKQDNTTTTNVDRHSAIIYLVLDSSKSLSSSDVSTVRNAAKAFIDKLQERYHKKY